MPDLSLTPQQTLLTESTVTDAITATKALLTTYEAVRLENFDLCNPDNRMKELRISITTADIADIPGIQAEIAAIVNAGPDAKGTAMRAVNAAFAASRTSLVGLCNTLVTKLNAYLTTARAAEDAFFATYSQVTPSGRTAVSSRYVAAIATVQQMLAGWQSGVPWDGLTTIDGQAINVFDWLGTAQIA